MDRGVGYVYREGLLSDLGSLYGLCCLFHSESVWDRYSLSPSRLRGYIRSYLDSDTRVVFVAESGGEIVGFIFGALNSPFWSDELSVYEGLWYVSPEHRGTLAGVRLVKCLSDWSESRGAKDFFVGHSSGMFEGRTGALMDRLGFSSAGNLYRKVL